MSTAETAASVAFRLAELLEEAGLGHAISGAVALAAHGVPRMTVDADLVVDAPPAGLAPIFDVLERAGCLFEREQAAREVAAASFFTARRGPIRVDVFVSHAGAGARRVAVEAPDGRARWFVSAEDLAVHKLALLRPKDRMDLELLFAAQGPTLDVGQVRRGVDAIAPDAADPRRAALDDLVRRFVPQRVG